MFHIGPFTYNTCDSVIEAHYLECIGTHSLLGESFTGTTSRLPNKCTSPSCSVLTPIPWPDERITDVIRIKPRFPHIFWNFIVFQGRSWCHALHWVCCKFVFLYDDPSLYWRQMWLTMGYMNLSFVYMYRTPSPQTLAQPRFYTW